MIEGDVKVYVDESPVMMDASARAEYQQSIAAGGIVQNEKKEILFIFRRGKWDLPKGKLDKGESPETAAKREVEEETGAKNLTIKEKIGDTFHVYTWKDAEVLKQTHWYYMTCTGEQKLLAQEEEDITEVRWFPTIDIKIPMANTHENIKDVMRKFFDKP